MVALSDVMEDILLRSDAKDLVPWKRVCKSWYSLITSPRFVKAHLKFTLDNNDSNNSLGHARIVMPSYWKIPNERLYQYNRWYVVGSSNGLVCISNCLGDPIIVVNNPCTTELRKLPIVSEKIGTETGGLSLSFAYDSSTDDYKVVMGIKKSNDVALVQVLSLKSNTWKIIGQSNYSFIFDNPGMLFNGKLHWVVYDTSERQVVILSFDLSLEEFKVIPQPNDSKYESLSCRFPSIGIVDDQFCLFFTKRRSNLPSYIWVMRSYNVDQSWELLPDNYEMKHEVVHYMKMIEYGSPMNKHTTFFFDDNKCLSRAQKYIKAYTFVPSLVSPYAGRPSHAKNNKTSFIAWSFKAAVEEGQHSQAMVRRVIQASEEETRKIEEVYRQEVGETENVFVHEYESGDIEVIRPKLEGVTLCAAERGINRYYFRCVDDESCGNPSDGSRFGLISRRILEGSILYCRVNQAIMQMMRGHRCSLGEVYEYELEASGEDDRIALSTSAIVFVYDNITFLLDYFLVRASASNVRVYLTIYIPTHMYEPYDKSTMVNCFCGRRANIITSWTNKNLGIVDWVDPPVYHRAVNIIPGLLRARNKQEAQLLEAHRGRQRLMKLLVMSCFIKCYSNGEVEIIKCNHLVIVFQRELYEEEQWRSFCRGSYFQISERMRHKDVVIGNIVALDNHEIAHRDVSYLREMQDQDMNRLQLFRAMVRDSYHCVRRKRWFINMVTVVLVVLI
ncbi:putative F-box domain-containing protein [Tanacetum coccineum]|uniref:F-box domain-containing protein n=1 Tax=Tanacetum coccineum TaxID=301880 RepID=A0ABQ5CYD5_9ASTR